LAGGEGWGQVKGVDYVVHHVRIAAAGDVVEASTQGPIVVEEMEFLFELHVQGEVIRKSFRTGLSNEFMLIVQKAERKSGAGFHGIGDFELVKDGKREQRKISPGKKAVGSVPEIRAGLLRTKLRIIDIEVEDLIGA